MKDSSIALEVAEAMNTDYVRGLSYHGQSHRAYRAVRARVALRLSPFHPRFAGEVLEEFRALVAHLRLVPPGLEGSS